MNAMARPGKRFNIGEQSSKLESSKKVLLAGAMTFLDHRCSYCVCGNDELGEQIQEYTMAKKVKIKDADMIFVPLGSVKTEEIEKILGQGKSGTLAQPHQSVTLLIETKERDNGEKVILEGPGIDGEIQIKVSGEEMSWMKEREKQNYEFPCGVDLIFCTENGEIMGLPRTTKVKKGGEV